MGCILMQECLNLSHGALKGFAGTATAGLSFSDCRNACMDEYCYEEQDAFPTPPDMTFAAYIIGGVLLSQALLMATCLLVYRCHNHSAIKGYAATKAYDSEI